MTLIKLSIVITIPKVMLKLITCKVIIFLDPLSHSDYGDTVCRTKYAKAGLLIKIATGMLTLHSPKTNKQTQKTKQKLQYI